MFTLQHISELKKENFELKLRIYFLEEKLQNSQRNLDDNDTFKMVQNHTFPFSF